MATPTPQFAILTTTPEYTVTLSAHAGGISLHAERSPASPDQPGTTAHILLDQDATEQLAALLVPRLPRAARLMLAGVSPVLAPCLYLMARTLQ